MSRFVAWLDALDAPLDAATPARASSRRCSNASAPPRAASRRASRSSCASARRSPASRACSSTRAASIGETRGGATTVWVEVVVPVKSLCPCSKEISDYGAHNQRSHVTIRVEPLAEIGWPELVRFAEDSASSEIWPMLKRADEKWVTERAYENPKFVEDMVRDVALRLERRSRASAATRSTSRTSSRSTPTARSPASSAERPPRRDDRAPPASPAEVRRGGPCGVSRSGLSRRRGRAATGRPGRRAPAPARRR